MVAARQSLHDGDDGNDRRLRAAAAALARGPKLRDLLHGGRRRHCRISTFVSGTGARALRDSGNLRRAAQAARDEQTQRPLHHLRRGPRRLAHRARDVARAHSLRRHRDRDATRRRLGPIRCATLNPRCDARRDAHRGRSRACARVGCVPAGRCGKSIRRDDGAHAQPETAHRRARGGRGRRAKAPRRSSAATAWRRRS